MALHDEAAAARLRREVQRQYEAHRKERFTKSGLALATGHSRPTLDHWLEDGYMPSIQGMTSLADAVGVQPAQLWVKWLDLSTSDPLVRIADALERAYPPDPAAEEEESQTRAASFARSNPAPPGSGAPGAPPAPPSKAGSGR